jgi:hypothetical protein
MYLVELRPGKEELYRTGDDLALAIRDGGVDARSRIYHRATAKWISITLHPQYKAIVEGQQAEQARPARKGWGILQDVTSQAEGSLSVEEANAGGDGLERWKRPLGLGLSSILLVLGVQLASSGPRPPWADQNKTAVVSSGKSEIEPEDSRDSNGDEESELVSLASTAVRWPDSRPVAERVTTPVSDAPILPRAPKLRRKALRASLVTDSGSATVKANSVQAILTRYEVASDSALARLESGMRVARMNRLFSASRLSPGGGVTDTRLRLAGAVNIIRKFRQQQAVIDQAYQDSVALAKEHGWSPKEVRRWSSRPQRAETPTLVLVSNALVADIDSLLGLLGAQAGAYKLRGTAIAFEDPSAGQAYGTLRRSIKGQIEAAVAAGGSTSSGPTTLLLQAIGTSSLPRET